MQGIVDRMLSADNEDAVLMKVKEDVKNLFFTRYMIILNTKLRFNSKLTGPKDHFVRKDEIEYFMQSNNYYNLLDKIRT